MAQRQSSKPSSRAAKKSRPKKVAWRYADHRAPFLAGVVASITGTAASAGLVLAALTSLGATKSQTTSAIVVLIALYGLLSIILSTRYKMPISIV